MPRWLVKQLMRAFHDKDRRQIRFLNKCWFHFQQKERA
ncbi:cortex morphogenetic protein CmpA [Paenactinomyces guangxiensis]|uniref:Cortex morphogenetic protein CmpA n=2 Tax=Paenactinomyces guangxiensis TaxID=1490290 RepID=A0A7W1WU56_9BACL|nr:cortex morphogenetic protein CmpA [Paenactinomyces guangxiensis]MBA4496002.1 cortex morphogenetic protein CmpA [Paenactinomyces guangxiensis]MBH8593122.1 cortex morphogenetic protein CmpA [Paenactinomyces guangxiensis]